MEEWVGLQWHRWVSARAGAARQPHEALLATCRRPVELLLRAGGARQRIAEAAPIAVGGARGFWQRLAGSGRRQPLAQLDADVLALPARVVAFDAADLNADLYRWWAALASCLDLRLPWAQANRNATVGALARFPGLRERWQRLHDADDARLAGCWPDGDALPADGPPVWTWLVPQRAADPRHAVGDDAEPAPSPTPSAEAERLAARRRARRQGDGAPPRAPLLLAAKGESLKTYADAFSIDRAHDDEDDGSAAVAAEEIETLTLAPRRGSLASRLRLDLDLPSAAADDLPVGPGLRLPEWDLRAQSLRVGRVLAQRLQPRDPVPWQLPAALRVEAARVRRRLETQRAAPRWRRGVADGEALDLDALVRARGTRGGRAAEAVYCRRERGARDLATVLMADLSLSTDAHVSDQQRVIDVIRDALAVFATALDGCGDACEMLGFSSVKRTLRLHELKRFDEPLGAPVLARLGALRPGYYTRMGAAVRAGTQALAARPERTRLLLLLTDGKPHDLDGYEGRAGIEDTRHAVLEARRAGVLPFALSIDAEAPQVMPMLFGGGGALHGRGGWAWVQRPQDLPLRLAALYGQLTR